APGPGRDGPPPEPVPAVEPRQPRLLAQPRRARPAPPAAPRPPARDRPGPAPPPGLLPDLRPARLFEPRPAQRVARLEPRGRLHARDPRAGRDAGRLLGDRPR